MVIIGAALMVIGCLGCLVIVLNYERKAAQFDIEAVGRVPQATEVLDAAGSLIGYLHGDNIGTPVELKDVSPHFVLALINREDTRFHRHHGVDHVGLARAWLRNIKDKRIVQGGSTLTMQLTRMTYGLTGRDRSRKMLEMSLSRRIERHYSKEEILLHYINRVFLGTGMNGIEQAARGYFDKSAAELTLPEAAMIAGVIRAPNRFSPFRNYEGALAEMRSTITRMEAEGVIEPEQAEEMRQARPVVQPQARWMETLRLKSKVSEKTYVLQMVEDRIKELFPSYIGVGGLKVHTTFDMRLQQASEAALEQHLEAWETRPGYPHPRRSAHAAEEPEYLQGSTVVVENQSGAIRALVGGRSFRHSEFNRATQARRTMGSVFKPLVYGTAFEKGLLPGVLISDASIEPGEIPWDKENWSPSNADETFGGMLPVAHGLVRSRNTMTARVGEWAGIEDVVRMMHAAGVHSRKEIEVSPQLYIGTSGASNLDLSSAYSIFANGGTRYEPFFIDSVLDRDGSELFVHEMTEHQVMSSGAAWLTASLLKQVLDAGGTASELRDLGFDYPAAVKTGTTNDFHDAWFMGCTSRLSAGVWVGLDQPKTISDNAYGGRLALPIWKDVMTAAAEIGYEFQDFASPEEIIEMEICRHSGLMAKDKCHKENSVYIEHIPHDLIPRKFCRGQRHP